MLPDAKLYYYKARVYDPVMGRFLQTDPVGSKDDLDLYAYTAGDPVNRGDPTGLCVIMTTRTRMVYETRDSSGEAHAYIYDDITHTPVGCSESDRVIGPEVKKFTNSVKRTVNGIENRDFGTKDNGKKCDALDLSADVANDTKNFMKGGLLGLGLEVYKQIISGTKNLKGSNDAVDKFLKSDGFQFAEGLSTGSAELLLAEQLYTSAIRSAKGDKSNDDVCKK